MFYTNKTSFSLVSLSAFISEIYKRRAYLSSTFAHRPFQEIKSIKSVPKSDKKPTHCDAMLEAVVDGLESRDGRGWGEGDGRGRQPL